MTTGDRQIVPRWTTLGEVLSRPDAYGDDGWLFLPGSAPWVWTSAGLVAGMKDLAPEEHTDDTAPWPDEARERGMVVSLDMATVYDVVDNLRQQMPTPAADDLLKAFLHYFDRDAFVNISTSSPR